MKITLKRKIVSIILALVLLVSLSVPSLAAESLPAEVFNPSWDNSLEFGVSDDGSAALFGFIWVNSETPVTITCKIDGSDDVIFSEDSYVSTQEESSSVSVETISEDASTITIATIDSKLNYVYGIIIKAKDGITKVSEYPFTVIFTVGDIEINRAENIVTPADAPADTSVDTPDVADDTPSEWAFEQVNAAIAAKLVPEALQSKYPKPATRAEFAALAVALYETATGGEIAERVAFSDTTDVNVEKAAAIGVVAGVGDNMFDPDAELTREQAAVMLARLVEAIGKPLAKQAATFADNGSISDWAAEQVGQIQAAGIMGGVGNNTFAPQDPYTREQSIVTLLRLRDYSAGTSTQVPVTESTAAIPVFEKNGYEINMVLGTTYPFTTATESNPPVTTTGRATVTDFKIIDSDENYAARDGYEWRIATLRYEFDDENAQQYGATVSFMAVDYFNAESLSDTFSNDDGVAGTADPSSYTIKHNGVDYVYYTSYDFVQAEWVGTMAVYVIEYAVSVPVGYDGIVIASCNDIHYVENAEQTALDFIDEGTLFFRMDN